MKATTTPSPRSSPTVHNPGMRPQDWHAAYWDAKKHGVSWERVKLALERDWAQTRADAGSGKDLHQSVVDTMKQAVGKGVIPPPNQPNPAPPDWKAAEPAVRYGVGAHEQYGSKYAKWNDELEVKLSTEWDEAQTGRSFADARADVLAGWHGKA